MTKNKALDNLRHLMEERGITAYIEPTADPHQSEYVADYYKSRAYISGFTGSAGIVVITQDMANLWTDGRYFIQAEKEIMNTGFKLYKTNTPGYPSYIEWINNILGEGDTIGFNGKIFSQKTVEELKEGLQEKEIKFLDSQDLIGQVWEERPNLPFGLAYPLEKKYAGKTALEKLKEVRKIMKEKNGDYFLLSSLDDIAWLYNIRGRDVKNNPVVISYALISEKKAYLFVDRKKINSEMEEFLSSNSVEVYDYEKVVDFVKEIEGGTSLLLDKARTNRWLYNSIPNNVKIYNQMDITTKLKGIKNKVEIENQKKAYIKDGVALTKFLYWLDKNLGKIEISELSAGEKLLSYRQEQVGFLEASFDTISAYKENAAMMHYSANKESNKIFKKEGLYLVDSGGQYFEGTTDITRTISLGEISQEEKRDFTLTLKGHINLSSARFLEATSGHALDVLSRYPLWQEGIDYKSGTGHGIGYLLNVHEGPHRIAREANNIPLEEGMIVTIEPGVYKAGSHGIRIENVVVVEKDIKTESGQFMKFETISFVPIDLACIDTEILSHKEKKWLNEYHANVYRKISPYLEEEEKEWLRKETRMI